MSFREKTAWITATTIVICFGAYYGAIFTGLVERNTLHNFHLGLACIIALLVLQIALNLVAAMLNPKEARTPRDERERMIHARSHIVGYYVLMVGIAVVLILTHVPIHGNFFELMVNTVNLGVGVMVIAALGVAVAQIIMFRRGS
jgi:hypothetical protein